MNLRRNFTTILLINLLLINVLYCWLNENKSLIEKEYFILGTNVALYKTFSSDSPKLLIMNEFDKVVLLNKKIKNNRLNVSFNGTNGWVNILNLSVTPEGWEKFDKISGLILFYPKEYDYQFRTNNFVRNDYIEFLLYNKESDIVIYHSLRKNSIQEYTNGIKLNFYGKEVYYYIGIGPEDGKVGYEFVVANRSAKKNYVINVSSGKQHPTPEEELIAKKILFSVRIKP